MRTTLLLVALAVCITSACSYKVLCIFAAPSKSSDHLGQGFVRALLKAGHQVTWATPFPEKKDPHPNLDLIDLKETRKLTEGVDMSRQQNGGLSFIRAFARNISRTAADSPELKRALVEKQYDAIISMWFMNEYEAGYAAVQQVPWLLLSSVVIHPYLEGMVDQVHSIPTIPFMVNECDLPMSAWRRWINGLIYMIMTVDGWFDKPRQAVIYEDIYAPLAAARGVPLPSYYDAVKNVSFLFVNSHESIAPALSLPPNVLNIAGYHIDDNLPPLPKDLQDLLDNSKNGLIYFSMGSVVQSAGIEESTRAGLLEIFAKLPYTVLWKFEKTLKDLPPNVHVRPWLPQPSILAHPNLRLFITHGGQLSCLEAIHAGVPMLAVPVFGDQPANAERAVKLGYALKVDFHNNLVKDLDLKLNEMLRNDTYYKNAKYLSKMFHSRPTKPSQLIPYAVELAIETKGAFHLRSKTLQYSWYELWMIDFVLILLTIVTLVLLLLRLILRFVLSKCRGATNVAKKNN
ncbi:UDP-glucuronosyltransferase 2B2-like [Trichoplusia ni]|uniref:UDP-glucuronosyltransferase n=1 Tax=Trichoplusia ni TaxID=7111 RepID=A0A7E5VBI0_TRINI|nr:UDP-glucuronosyltransferase 2B2-like [Trichoplusia ni]